MCTYCGHVSRRPVLDVPGGVPSSGMAGSIASAGNTYPLTGSTVGLVNGGGIFAARNSKVWNGRGLPDRSSLGGGKGWMGARPWTTEGGGWGASGFWFGGSWPGSPGYFGTAGSWGATGASLGGAMFGAERCAAGESYSGLLLFFLRAFSYVLFCVGWIWKRLWRAEGLGEDGMGGGRQSCQRRGDDGGPSPGTRGEKARRKAEEKRQARLEKEQLEAEERKQREEVARLVEERRRQRDERLEAEKESEREAAAEREREIRREREAERRRQEKAKEREKLQAKDKSKDQDPDEMKRKKMKENEKRSDLERSEKREDPKAMLVNGIESGKLTKPSKGAVLDTNSKGNEATMKGAGNAATKWGSSKYLGSAKSGFFSHSKNVAASPENATSFWGRSLSTGSNPAGKVGKTVVSVVPSPPSTSNLSAGLTGKSAPASGSAWKRMPWTNVWGKASSKMPDDSSKMQSGVVDISDNRLDHIGGGAKDLVNGTVVSPSTVGVPLQPIAPPSALSNSWDNLFSSPSCFPPMELPVDTGTLQEQRQQTQVESKIHQAQLPSSSLPSSQFFLGTLAPALIPSSESFVQFPLSCTSSTAVETVLPSSICSDVSGSLNMDEFAGMDVPDPISLLGPVSHSLMTSFPIEIGTSVSPHIKSNPVSPIHAPFTAPMHMSPGIQSPVLTASQFTNVNKDQLPQILEPWGVPPVSLDGTKDNMSEGSWHLWGAPQLPQLTLPNTSRWNELLQQENRLLQPFSQSSLQSSFGPESQLPCSLFSPQQKHGSSDATHSERLCPVPLSGSNNIWLDPPALDSTMHIWEDPDTHHKVPPEFVDCITHALMQDPVITADGHSYERSAIEAWLKLHDTSPKTGEVLPPPPGGSGIGVDKTLRPNHILRGQIIEYKERLARGLGSQENQKESGWSTITGAESVSLWSTSSSATMRPHLRGFYPTPGVESVWSYNMS